MSHQYYMSILYVILRLSIICNIESCAQQSCVNDSILYVTLRMRHFVCMDESCNVTQCYTMTQYWMSHVIYILCGMTQYWMRHAEICDMTHGCMWHDSFINMTWCTNVCDMTYSYMYMTLLIDGREMTHSYKWYDTLMYVTCLIHIYDMNHGCIWDNSFM